MNTHLKKLLLISLLLFLPQALLASDMSAGCKSCVSGYDCSRINKTCNATCKANLYSEEIDLDSCRAGCIGKLERCLLDANKSCKFYCAD
jgi:hypothetical protein